MKRRQSRRSLYRPKVWAELTRRYGTKCVYCNRNIATQIDHVIPYAYSFDSGIDNLRPSCYECNICAHDRVFNSFEAKRSYIRKHVKINRLLTCSVCMLPYYSALCPSAFFCPHCYALEYDDEPPNDNAWHQWLQYLRDAAICPEAHFLLREYIDDVGVSSMSLHEKIEFVVDITFDRVDVLPGAKERADEYYSLLSILS